MNDTPRWRRYLRFWASDPAADLDDELRFHLEMRERDLIARGLAAGAAQAQAECEFGDVASVRAACVTIDERRARRADRLEWRDAMWTDLTFAVRTLRKSPGFALAAICSLALGIGACTTIFSAMEAVILRALPYRAVDRVVSISTSSPSCEQCNATPGDYFTVRDDHRTFSSVAEYAYWNGTLAGRAQAEPITGLQVTPSFFATLGVDAALGRTFAAESVSRAPSRVVVLGDRFWRSHYGADPRVIGRVIAIDDVPFTVVGIMPPRFIFPVATDVLLPLQFTPAAADNFLWGHFSLLGRLAPGMTVARTQREAALLSTRITARLPEQRSGWRLVVRPLREATLHTLRRYFVPLMGAVVFVLLIVCANVANLTLVRASSRGHELAVRAALGAGRRRIVHQLLVESTVVAGLGAALGLALAWRAVPVLRHVLPQSMAFVAPGWDGIRLDGRALAFTVVIAVASTMLFGLLPALRASRPGVIASLREGARTGVGAHGSRMRHGLVVIEFSLAMILLVSAGLMGQTFANLLRTDTGVHADRVLVLPLQVPARHVGGTGRTHALYERIRAAAGALPGAEGAAGTVAVPLDGNRNIIWFNLPGEPLPPGKAPQADQQIVTPGYFRVLGIPLLSGRDFTAHDDSASAGVAIISEAMARRYWPGADPLGRELVVGGGRARIIGIAADVRSAGVESAPVPTIYQPNAQCCGIASLDLVVRATGDPSALTAAIRRTLASVDPEIAIGQVQTMPEVESQYLLPWRVLMTLLGMFAAAALLIAAIGIYGVLAYAVAQRTREIGIRMALGAGGARVRAMVLRDAIGLAVGGAVIGVLGALAATRALAFMLYGVQPRDPAMMLAAAGALTLAALVASWIPARRATKIDPLVAMRAE